MIAYNLPRRHVNIWEYPLDAEKYCWVSIMEPGQSHVQNDVLDNLPHLKIKFWDTKVLTTAFQKQPPPTVDHAKEIVDFLLKHRGKAVISNCYAGISRSGAVSQFCVDMLGYKWDIDSEKRADPNYLLYGMMKKYYLKNNAPATKVVDKRNKEQEPEKLNIKEIVDLVSTPIVIDTVF